MLKQYLIILTMIIYVTFNVITAIADDNVSDNENNEPTVAEQAVQSKTSPDTQEETTKNQPIDAIMQHHPMAQNIELTQSSNKQKNTEYTISPNEINVLKNILSDPNKSQQLASLLNTMYQNPEILQKSTTTNTNKLTNIIDNINVADLQKSWLDIIAQVSHDKILNELHFIPYKHFILIMIIFISFIIVELLIKKIFHSLAYQHTEYSNIFKLNYKNYFLFIKQLLLYVLRLTIPLLLGIATSVIIAFAYWYLINDVALEHIQTSMIIIMVIVITRLFNLMQLILANQTTEPLITKRIKFINRLINIILLMIAMFVTFQALYPETKILSLAFYKLLNIIWVAIIALLVINIYKLIKILLNKVSHPENSIKYYSPIILLFILINLTIIFFIQDTSIYILDVYNTLIIFIIAIVSYNLNRIFLIYVFHKLIKKKISKIEQDIDGLSFADVFKNKINTDIFWRLLPYIYKYIVFYLTFIVSATLLEFRLLELILHHNAIHMVLNITNVIILFYFLNFGIWVLIHYVCAKLHILNKDKLVYKILSIFILIKPLYIGVMIVGFLISILSILNISFEVIFASTGMITFLLAFGMRDILMNFVNAFLFLLRDTLALGDKVSINGMTGTVEDIDNNYVKIRDQEGLLHLIPFNHISTISRL